MINEKIKVLIVDDSALFRQLLSRIVAADSGLEIIGTAADPFIAASKISVQVPDVIILDHYMPRMDGLTFLKKIMSQHPIPVVFIAEEAGKSSELAVKALEVGAFEVLSKEIFSELNQNVRLKICDIIRAASSAPPKKKLLSEALTVKPKLNADAVLQKVKVTGVVTSDKVVAVGASTGGTEAIRMFLEGLPLNCPGVVIVQHMPENFTKSFADRLNDLCRINVKEACDGDLVKPGTALIAPGNQHMLLKRRGSQYFVELNKGPLVNRHRPSVDVLFRSASIYAAQNCFGVLLTGMGDDGAKGLLEIKQAGGRTIAQDEKTSVVFGMPKEAIQLKAAEKILPVQDIARYVMQLSGK
ncbi:protein-glutamate methylesterase/protein-glutamine glutaminase [Desertivirga arenae]|uniref:protein-glutamate methylesterase/protein-glutamine glutaminase n=1 Tax=Desertivirga arenae TaxID=2810309 RepID=UPI001A969431|nr:chemotaxis response regulator protein-glutamate methylesterase [Pedobacter sp. SYSU D00823]